MNIIYFAWVGTFRACDFSFLCFICLMGKIVSYRCYFFLCHLDGYFPGIWSSQEYRPHIWAALSNNSTSNISKAIAFPPPIMLALMSPIVHMLYCGCRQSLKPFNPPETDKGREWSRRDGGCGAQINFKTTYEVIRHKGRKGAEHLLCKEGGG